MDSKARIDQLFNHLDRWRHLPSYQLERRADIIFSLYLPEILEWKLGTRPKHIIPEFPVRVSIEDPDAGSNRSVKIDYLAVMDNPAGLILVELKTDAASIRQDQIEYLLAAQKAQKKNRLALLNGLKKIYEATKEKDKYGWLLKELSEAGLIDLFPSGTFEPRRDLPGALQAKILFIKSNDDPIGQGIMSVSFDEVAQIVDSHKDDLSVRFAESLRRWTSEPVGRKGSSRDKMRKD